VRGFNEGSCNRGGRRKFAREKTRPARGRKGTISGQGSGVHQEKTRQGKRSKEAITKKNQRDKIIVGLWGNIEKNFAGKEWGKELRV